MCLYILLENFYYHNDSQSPDQRKLQANVAMKIKGFIWIIPPSCVETHIQQPACNQLHRSCQNNSKHKNHSITHLTPAALNCIEQSKNRKHPKSIYRADRSIQETSVYNFSQRYCMKNNFNNPAAKRINKKIQTYLKIRHSTNHSLLLLAFIKPLFISHYHSSNRKLTWFS